MSAVVGSIDVLKKVLEEKVGQLVSLGEDEKKKLVEALVAEVASFLEPKAEEAVAVVKKGLVQMLMEVLRCVSSKAGKPAVVEPQVVRQDSLPQVADKKQEETRPSTQASAPSPQEVAK